MVAVVHPHAWYGALDVHFISLSDVSETEHFTKVDVGSSMSQLLTFLFSLVDDAVQDEAFKPLYKYGGCALFMGYHSSRAQLISIIRAEGKISNKSRTEK